MCPITASSPLADAEPRWSSGGAMLRRWAQKWRTESGRSAQFGHQFLFEVRRQAAELRLSTDRSLRGAAQRLRERVRSAASPAWAIGAAPACALFVEALRRTMGMECYDVQILAGLALDRGQVAEMQTGEGKTLAVALAAFLGTLAASSVHVVTTNAYLAERDCHSLQPTFDLLSTTAGLLPETRDRDQKRAAYGCDITYGTGYEFGFDYLRDQLALRAAAMRPPGEFFLGRLRGEEQGRLQPLQRGLALAIVDEVDSVLIDEACTPLILSQAERLSESHAQLYTAARAAARRLVAERDYALGAADSRVELTPAGRTTADLFLDDRLRRALARPWWEYVTQALHAEHGLRRDVHYVVEGDEIRLVDENTGRLCPDRSWRGGLHQAVQAKEGVICTAEADAAARISRQRYFRLYARLCGTTGTARSAEQEFWEVYRLSVAVIPLRTPSRRAALPSRFFASQEAKYSAVAQEVQRFAAAGRPVLIGTRTIADSELLSQRLKATGTAHQLLNGLQDEEESQIIARAGGRGVVTIATNMAGRGTDIRLAPGVADLGGLHVIVCEPHSARRIDRQLVGRGARQGDPGSYRKYASAEDDLIRRHASGLGERICRSCGLQGESSVDFSQQVEKVQRRVERLQTLTRRGLLKHDQWLEGLTERWASWC